MDGRRIWSSKSESQTQIKNLVQRGWGADPKERPKFNFEQFDPPPPHENCARVWWATPALTDPGVFTYCNRSIPLCFSGQIGEVACFRKACPPSENELPGRGGGRGKKP